MGRGWLVAGLAAGAIVLAASPPAQALDAVRFDAGYGRRGGSLDPSVNAFDLDFAFLAGRDSDGFAFWAPIRFTWGGNAEHETVGALRAGFEAAIDWDRVHTGVGFGPAVLWSHRSRLDVYVGVGADFVVRFDVLREARFTGYAVLSADASGGTSERPSHDLFGFTFVDGSSYGGGLALGVEWELGKR